MARKKKSQFRIPPLLIKIVLVLVLSVGVGGFVSVQVYRFFLTSQYFEIQKIVIDPGLEFIDPSDFQFLEGENLISFDLKIVQSKLTKKYPQVDDLKVLKKFPNEIHILAKKRLPFIQFELDGDLLTLDRSGVVIAKKDEKIKGLPLIVASNLNKIWKPILGLPVSEKQISEAVMLSSAFNEEEGLTAYSIEKVDMNNLSKIELKLNNGVVVYLDKDRLKYKMRVLSLVLSQGQLNLKEIKYIDLRFKEPLIGKI